MGLFERLLFSFMGLWPAQDAERGVEVVDAAEVTFDLDYAGRHAVVIGIDQYDDPGYPDLSYAVADAKAFAGLLVDRFGFPKENIHLLLNDDATRDAIDRTLQESACDQKRIGMNDLVVVFFAGHGVTREGFNKQGGYLVPQDGRRDREDPAWGTLIGMDLLADISEYVPAKHAVFVLDCCFGGLALERSLPPIAAGLTNRARQVMTAGTAKQKVQDGGGGGHSVFTAALLDGLKGVADGNADKVITFGELYDYVGKRVEAETAQKQTPIQARLSGDDGGNVSFFPPGVTPEKMTAAERLRLVELDKEELLAENERLSDVILVEQLEKEADALWPRRPEKVPQKRRWLGPVRDVRLRLPVHEASLQRIKQQAILSQVVAGLIEDKESSEVIWEKADPVLQLRHRQFSGLVAHLRAMDPLIADVEGRVEIATMIEQKTIADFADEWESALDDIRESTRHEGLELEPQIGLVPLEPDPESGLWEFWVWESGAKPERDEATSRWRIKDDTGIILVLLAGGTFKMGATSDPKGPNYDAGARPDEEPVHDLTLDPFFMSKYEMTQGQWFRVMGTNPSYYGKGSEFIDEENPLSHPVEQVSWEDCTRALERLALVLPTEAQWECAARGGADSPWWTGSDEQALKDAANLADQYCRTHGGPPEWTYESWDDGFTVHAPVGRFRVNDFGLHDVAGNLFEWCRDWYVDYKVDVKPGDGERKLEGTRSRVIRGGSFYDPAPYARSASRSDGAPEYRINSLGVRPARVFEP